MRYQRQNRQETIAFREIRRYQRSTKLLLSIIPFQCIVRNIAKKIIFNGKFQGKDLRSLQETSEGYIILLFMNKNLCALHAN